MNILQNKKVREIVYQLLLVTFFVMAILFARNNLVDNLTQRNIATGFGFLQNEASFDISESLIEFSAADTYLRAFTVGFLNTIKVAFLGIIFAVLLGLIAGICLLSSNWLLQKTAYGYVNALRNTPLILQLLMWYALLTAGLPEFKNAIELLPHVYLSNRGINLPSIDFIPTHLYMLIGFLAAIVINYGIKKHFDKKQIETGIDTTTWPIRLFLIFALTLLPWVFMGMPLEVAYTELGTFGFTGGAHVSPEFLSLLFGLVIYTSTFIAEIVRAGIVAVSKGQTEAGLALGLTRGQLLRMIILPQALRVIIPPLTNQILNLTKNSTLAIAIGYPDFLSIANTSLNQTGQAIEAITMVMGLYLTVSLLTSFFLNWFNKKVRIKER